MIKKIKEFFQNFHKTKIRLIKFDRRWHAVQNYLVHFSAPTKNDLLIRIKDYNIIHNNYRLENIEDEVTWNTQQ